MIRKYFSVLFITVVLVWFLMSQIETSAIWDNLKTVNFLGLAGGFSIYFCYHILITFRFGNLIHSKNPPFINLFGIISTHNMLNNLLPARAGELSYIYFLKERFNITGSEGLATLMVARLMDAIVILSYFIIASFFISRGELTTNIYLMIVLFVTLLIAILFGLQKCVEYFVCAVGRVFSTKFRIREMFIERGKTISLSLKEISSNHQYYLCFALTFVIWALKYLMLHVVVRSMGVSVDLWAVVFAGTAMYIVSSLPIQGFAGFGTLESGWAAGFILAGISKDIAISTAFSFHLILLLFTIILGISGLILMRVKTV